MQRDSLLLITTAGVRVPDVVWMPEEKWLSVHSGDRLVQAYLASGIQEVMVVGLNGAIEYHHSDGKHQTSIHGVTLTLPSPLFTTSD